MWRRKSVSLGSWSFAGALSVGCLLWGQEAGKTAPPPPAPAGPEEPELSPGKTRSLQVDQRDYELFKVFVDTLDQVERNYVKEVDRRELMEAAVRGLLTKLDPYSNYIPPEEVAKFRDSLESQFGGIGIQIVVEQGQLKILSPLVGTPAYRAGLHAGDLISEIDGKGTQGITVDDAVKRLKGTIGTEVKLKVRAAYVGTVRELVLKRELIHVETVLGDRRKSGDAWDFMLDREKKIGYVRITSFSRETSKEVRDAVRSLVDEGMRGLVLDLRFNPGGLLGSAIEICDHFVKDGKIVSTRGRNVEEKIWHAKEEGTFPDFPMAVLINRYSASASEIVSACLQDHKRAIVIGERSWGKGSVQNVIDLEEGKSALKLTTASYWRPSGKNIHRFEGAPESAEWGVSPDAGFEVRLGSDELRDLVEHRRRRDLIKWTAEDAAKLAPPKPEPAATETSALESARPAPVEPTAEATPAAPPMPDRKADQAKDKAAVKDRDADPLVDSDAQLRKAVEYLIAELAKRK